MIPQTNDGLRLDFQFGELPTNTFRLNVSKDTIAGCADRLRAMAQAIYLILNVERYEHIIYSRNYGIELADLFGKPIPFVIPEFKRRITEALMQDGRITAVDNFEFTHIKGKIHTTFTVHTVFGDIDTGKEVTI